MPKLVCTTCKTELRPSHNGTLVIEMASFGPYKVWNSDTWKCPGCGVEIVAGFANNPLRQDHYSDDFPEWLEKVKRQADEIVYDFESPQP
jgi:hypothetical protein